MHAVNVTELRNHLPKYLLSVQKGEEISITLHGQIIAIIIPPIDAKLAAQKKLRELRKTCYLGDVVSPLQEKWDADQ